MGRRINTIMQTCFFALSDILPKAQAIEAIKAAVEKTYGRKGRRIVDMNFQAIDSALAGLHEIPVPEQVTTERALAPPVPPDAPQFVLEVTGEIIAGRGDAIPVSKLPADGTFPLGTAAFEKRNLALEIPVWDAELCTQCGKCPLVCPHSAIRSKIFPEERLKDAQVAPEDCTGCTLCVDICPIHDKSNVSRKALNMAPQPPLRAQERDNWNFFLTLPDYDPRASCSAIACWWPMPPAAPPSTAATCPPRPGPSTMKAAARPGTTPCSRTMPNSVSACAWPWTSSSNRPANCCCACGIDSTPIWWKICCTPISPPRRGYTNSASA